MSEKKSWDIPRRAKPTQRSAPAQTTSAPRSMNEVRPHVSVERKPKAPVAAAPISLPSSAKKNVTIARGKKHPVEAREPLKKRRKQQKKVMIIFFSILAVILIAVSFYIIWLPALRINDVTAEGPRAEEVQQLTRTALYGSHLFIVPRNSLFFIPESDIRSLILKTYPDVEAVSLSTHGLNTLTVSTTPRAEVFDWCGLDRETADGNCYTANAEGFIFAAIASSTASTSAALKVYGPLDREVGETPIRARVSVANRLPEVLRMIRAIESFGSDVVALAIHEDEANLYLASGTRVTYVIGQEEQAAGLAASVFPQLNLNDGSVQYVDLRFAGKAYFRRVGE